METHRELERLADMLELASGPLFGRYLFNALKAFGPDADLAVQALRAYSGRALWMSNVDNEFIHFCGPSGTGKTTIATVYKEMLGDYAYVHSGSNLRFSPPEHARLLLVPDLNTNRIRGNTVERLLECKRGMFTFGYSNPHVDAKAKRLMKIYPLTKFDTSILNLEVSVYETKDEE